MSLDIVIRRQCTENKSLPLSVILGEQLRFGYFDRSWRMVVNELGDGEFTAFDPSMIARGFIVSWQPGESDQVALKLLMPSTRRELRTFFDCVLRIADFWGCDQIEVNDSPVSPSAFENGFTNLADYNDETIMKMANRIISGERQPTTLISAIYPLTVGIEESEKIKEDINYFETWMHKCQSIYAYYASPRYYRDAEGVYARYHFTENILNILPAIPRVQYGTRDERTGQPLVCERFGVFLVSTTLHGSIAMLDYDTFLARLDQSKVSRFDDDHILIQPMNLEELKVMAGITPMETTTPEADDITTEQKEPENTMNETGVIPIPRDESESA